MSELTIDVVDVDSGQPLEGATVSVNGRAQGQTDSYGYFGVYADDTDTVTVSYVGYSPFSMPQGILEETGQVRMSKINSSLPAVVVTPSPSPGSNNSDLWPLVILGGLGFALATTKKAKSVGKISKKDVGMIGIVAVAVGGVYLITKSKQPATAAPGPGQVIPGAAPAPVTASQSLLNPSNISAGTSLLNSLKNLFAGGSSSAPAPGLYAPYTPVGIEQPTAGPINVSAGYNTLDPSAGLNLNFPSDYGAATQAPAEDVSSGEFFDDSYVGGVGDVSADTFSAADIVGKGLIAAKTINLYDLPYDDATITGTIKTGQTVGVVYSWIDADPTVGRNELFWMFQNQDGSFYYTPHIPGNFNVQSLVEQGVQTQQQKDIANEPVWEQLIKQYAPWLIGGIVVIGLGSAIIKKKL